jgi:flagellar export protein FliJ
MAKFQFKLDPVLLQRRAREDICQRELAKALRQRMILQSQLRTMQQTITYSKRDLADGLVGRIDMDRVSHFARYSSQVTHRAHAIVSRLGGVEKQINTAREKLAQATRARKALDLLRERRHRQWRQQLDRREAAQLDELAVQRYARDGMMGGAA